MNVYRMQDHEGRGPFKPGFTKEWSEDREDLDNLTSILKDWHKVKPKLLKGYHVGCACKSLEQLQRWFTPTEYERLLGHGYKVVSLKPGMILLETEVQVVFQRKLPLTQGIEEVDLYQLTQP